MYPLPLFQTISDDLTAIDSRIALRHQSAFMKNTLIRGLNTAYETAPFMDESLRRRRAFLGYVNLVLNMITFHIEGDQAFFSLPLLGEQPLQVELEMDAVPWDDQELIESIARCREYVVKSFDEPNIYSSKTLRDLLCFGERMVRDMIQELDCLCSERLEEIITHEALDLILMDHIDWLALNIDPSILIPFIVSHHDISQSIHWPTITAEGIAAMPRWIAKRIAYWRFAPFHAITRQKQTWQS